MPNEPLSAALNSLPGHHPPDVRHPRAGEAQTTRPTAMLTTPVSGSSGGSITPPPTTGPSISTAPASAGDQHGRDHAPTDAQSSGVTADNGRVVRGQGPCDAHLRSVLDDPLLALAAASLDDLERTRIAAENRLRQLTRDEPDKDNVERGFGLPDDDPQVRSIAAVVAGLAALEHGAELSLKRQLRRHPLHGWIKGTVGVGEKQAARLLAAIGDPYWNTLHNRPRTVSELWSYCGYRVVPAGHTPTDAHGRSASGAPDIPADHLGSDTQLRTVGGEQQDGDPGHECGDAHLRTAGVAVRRRKGQRANWSTVAKMRAFLIAESCIKQSRSPYRALYDQRRAHTALTRPQWTPGHSHNDALRVVAKEVLKDLWRAARDVHEPPSGQQSHDAQTCAAAGSSLPADHACTDAQMRSVDGDPNERTAP